MRPIKQRRNIKKRNRLYGCLCVKSRNKEPYSEKWNTDFRSDNTPGESNQHDSDQIEETELMLQHKPRKSQDWENYKDIFVELKEKCCLSEKTIFKAAAVLNALLKNKSCDHSKIREIIFAILEMVCETEDIVPVREWKKKIHKFSTPYFIYSKRLANPFRMEESIEEVMNKMWSSLNASNYPQSFQEFCIDLFPLAFWYNPFPDISYGAICIEIIHSSFKLYKIDDRNEYSNLVKEYSIATHEALKAEEIITEVIEKHGFKPVLIEETEEEPTQVNQSLMNESSHIFKEVRRQSSIISTRWSQILSLKDLSTDLPEWKEKYKDELFYIKECCYLCDSTVFKTAAVLREVFRNNKDNTLPIRELIFVIIEKICKNNEKINVSNGKQSLTDFSEQSFNDSKSVVKESLLVAESIEQTMTKIWNTRNVEDQNQSLKRNCFKLLACVFKANPFTEISYAALCIEIIHTTFKHLNIEFKKAKEYLNLLDIYKVKQSETVKSKEEIKNVIKLNGGINTIFKSEQINFELKKRESIREDQNRLRKMDLQTSSVKKRESLEVKRTSSSTNEITDRKEIYKYELFCIRDKCCLSDSTIFKTAAVLRKVLQNNKGDNLPIGEMIFAIIERVCKNDEKINVFNGKKSFAEFSEHSINHSNLTIEKSFLSAESIEEAMATVWNAWNIKDKNQTLKNNCLELLKCVFKVDPFLEMSYMTICIQIIHETLKYLNIEKRKEKEYLYVVNMYKIEKTELIQFKKELKNIIRLFGGLPFIFKLQEIQEELEKEQRIQKNADVLNESVDIQSDPVAGTSSSTAAIASPFRDISKTKKSGEFDVVAVVETSSNRDIIDSPCRTTSNTGKSDEYNVIAVAGTSPNRNMVDSPCRPISYTGKSDEYDNSTEADKSLNISSTVYKENDHQVPKLEKRESIKIKRTLSQRLSLSYSANDMSEWKEKFKYEFIRIKERCDMSDSTMFKTAAILRDVFQKNTCDTLPVSEMIFAILERVCKNDEKTKVFNGKKSFPEISEQSINRSNLMIEESLLSAESIEETMAKVWNAWNVKDKNQTLKSYCLELLKCVFKADPFIEMSYTVICIHIIHTTLKHLYVEERHAKEYLRLLKIYKIEQSELTKFKKELKKIIKLYGDLHFIFKIQQIQAGLEKKQDILDEQNIYNESVDVQSDLEGETSTVVVASPCKAISNTDRSDEYDKSTEVDKSLNISTTVFEESDHQISKTERKESFKITRTLSQRLSISHDIPEWKEKYKYELFCIKEQCYLSDSTIFKTAAVLREVFQNNKGETLPIIEMIFAILERVCKIEEKINLLPPEFSEQSFNHSKQLIEESFLYAESIEETMTEVWNTRNVEQQYQCLKDNCWKLLSCVFKANPFTETSYSAICLEIIHTAFKHLNVEDKKAKEHVHLLKKYNIKQSEINKSKREVKTALNLFKDINFVFKLQEMEAG